MLPWGHAAFGYLIYSAWRRARFGEAPRELPALALAVGTQLPDLVDKPLSWTYQILPSGRSLGHSALVLVVTGIVVMVALRWLVSRRTNDPRADGAGMRFESIQKPHLAFAALFVGWGSHLVGDSWQAFVGLDDCASYLLWPAMSICKYPEGNRELLAHLVTIIFSLDFGFGVLLTGIGVIVWIYDGKPGLNLLFQQIRRLVD